MRARCSICGLLTEQPQCEGEVYHVRCIAKQFPNSTLTGPREGHWLGGVQRLEDVPIGAGEVEWNVGTLEAGVAERGNQNEVVNITFTIKDQKPSPLFEEFRKKYLSSFLT